MPESAEQWLATLSEVRRQAARAAVLAGVQPPETDGQWYDVAEERTETSDLETLDETGAWRGLQWLNAFEILFFERPKELTGSEQQDDLLFFVVHEAYQGDDPGLLVRRKGRAMPEELGRGGQQAEHIDWRKSVLLNLVIQATYCLTVATCRRTDISYALQRGAPAAADVARVSKAVYASPMNIQVDIEGQRSKEEQPSVGYPDICFAIEDFDDAFRGLIVSEPGWCYVVTLSATGGPATAALPIIAPQLQADVAETPATQPSHSPTAAAQQPSHAAATLPRQASGRAPGRSAGAAAAEEALGKLPLSDQPQGSLQAPSQNSSAQDAHVSKGAEKPESIQAVSSEPGAAQAVSSEPVLAGRQGQQPGSSSASISDPLRGPPRPSAQPDSRDGTHNESSAASKQQVPPQAPQSPAQAHRAPAALGAVDLPLFTGFVSHEQLEAVIGSTSHERWLASRKELTHWVKMRGPGGQGHADVAVTCLLPLDEGHLAPTADDARRAGAPRGRGSSSPFRRVLSSVASSATKAAQAIVDDALGRGQGAGAHVRLRCALMRLSLPVELLAAQLLQLPLQDAASEA